MLAGLTLPHRGQRQVSAGITDGGASLSLAPQTWQTWTSPRVLVQTGRTE